MRRFFLLHSVVLVSVVIKKEERFSSFASPPCSCVHVWRIWYCLIISMRDGCSSVVLYVELQVPLSEILGSLITPVSIHCFLLPVVSWRITLSPGLNLSELFLPDQVASFACLIVLSSSMLLQSTSLSMLSAKFFHFLLRKCSTALHVLPFWT